MEQDNIIRVLNLIIEIVKRRIGHLIKRPTSSQYIEMNSFSDYDSIVKNLIKNKWKIHSIIKTKKGWKVYYY